MSRGRSICHRLQKENARLKQHVQGQKCLSSRSQKENARLKQHVLDVRRAARACGCDLNATEADAAAAYPELGEALGLAAAGAAGEESSQAPAPEHSQIHRPERHRRVPAS